jgi:hypothetical protein
MMRTRAAVLRKGGEPWEITELDLDEPNAGPVTMPYPILDPTGTTTTTKTARRRPPGPAARNAAISMVVRVFGEWSGAATPLEQLPVARERPAVGPKK